MAAQNGSLLQSLLADLLSGNYSAAAVWTTAILAGAALLSLLNRLLTPRLDPLEPPAVKPTVPLIGHIVGIIRHQSDYHRIIHNAHPSLPIATLPMLNGKLYSIYDPHLVQAALRSRIASFEPFVVDFAQKTFSLSEETVAKVKAPDVFNDFNDAIHSSFQAPMLHKMNVAFLASISAKMDPISDGTVHANKVTAGREEVIAGGLKVENLYKWCRDVMSLATTKALYGDHDPFSHQPELIEDLWTFEESVPYFLLSLFPSITMPKAYKARSTLQALMSKYYSSEHDINDPTTSQLVKNRAGALRKHSFTGHEVAQLEVILPNVATLNAVPTFYWLLLYVLDRPELVQRLRSEVEAAAAVTETNGKRAATFNIAQFDAQLPLLVSCYRETMRLSNHSVSMRRIMADMTIVGPDGQSYLLKKGTDLQLPAGVTHHDQNVWGDDVETFNAERFLPRERTATAETADSERRRKAAYFPFGGGRHLCPGRNFAFAEILGFMAVLLLGFDIEPVGMAFGDMKMRGARLAGGAVRPENYGKGLGANIVRRKGWENVEWKFEC
ncbi:7-alpha-hydroxycholest-4-en-3-one 12-alpha-hydroxylase [Fusarium albosuccineum]|uniref:7-alpha-hydroxycholest-4-en-3-one 12-alpha-hydroxylase n=1 Tax=Fusarium albosuccineum TaxID=1237068 RepID=A0A8H4LDE2_9HYPO|nr:7-alpha-hydroxycholest-4-en-3-one 12-alpha-hydroxylase [Fusarium albosuccineum]